MKTRLAAAVLLLSMVGASARAADAFKVIVNARLGGKAISRETLSAIYLGRVERWGDGHEIAAIDLSTTSPVRASFSQDVLGMSVLAVRQHWTRMIATSDHFPPLTRDNDEAVIAFVAARSGGVGYVSPDAVLPDSVRAVVLR
jgi:ABC-type phosphate transport system substrate-binding protein